MLNVRHILFLLTAMSFSQTVFGAAAQGNKTPVPVPLQLISLKGIFPFALNVNVADVVDRLKLLGKGKTSDRITFKFVQTPATAPSVLAAPRIHRSPAPVMIIGNVGPTALSTQPRIPSTIKHVACKSAGRTPQNSSINS